MVSFIVPAYNATKTIKKINKFNIESSWDKTRL